MYRCVCNLSVEFFIFFFQAEDGIRDLVRSRGLGDVYKRQAFGLESTCGVSRYLEENNIGFDVGVAKVPIVVGLSLIHI